MKNIISLLVVPVCFALLCGGAFDVGLLHLHETFLSGVFFNLPLLQQCPPRESAGDHLHLCIVVLGYQLNEDGSATEALTERVHAAASFYKTCMQRAEGAAALVFSGGTPLTQRTSEAAVMQAVALAALNATQPPRDFVLEEQSRTTYENALFSLQRVAHSKCRALGIATSPFHQLRALCTFRCLAPPDGSKVFLIASKRSPPSSAYQRIQRLWEGVRELGALAYYYCRGRLCCGRREL
jgi:uncharacterized SAM-binding protein YcdF (DUF218 family)